MLERLGMAGPTRRPPRTSLRPVRLRRQRRLVRVAERARVPGMGIRDSELVLLPEGLRPAARAVGARAVERSGGIVVEPGERAPRLALVLILLLAASGDLATECGTCAQHGDRRSTYPDREE